MQKTILNGAVIVSLLGLAACAPATIKPDALVAQCQAEAAPAGTYQYDEGPAVPVMTAVADGTQAGADAFNACIRNKAVAAGLIANPATARSNYCPDGAAVLYGGATYCTGTN